MRKILESIQFQFSFIYMVPNHNKSHLMTHNSHHEKALGHSRKEKLPLRGRNLGQSWALAGGPSALTGWVERERQAGRQAGRQAEIIIIIIEI